MNPRATLLLLALTLTVVGALFFLRRTVTPTREATENRRYAAVFEPEDIREIDIIRGQEIVSLRREPAGWRLTAPVEDRASPEVVDRLLMAARFMEVRDRQPGRDATKFPEAGLVPPRVRLELRGPKTVGIDIGGATALPQEVFARIDGDGGVLRVADTIAEVADGPPDSFRDARLTELVADDIEKFTVRRADGEMTLRRERGRWMIDKPVQAPADPREVRAFLEPLLGLRIAEFGPRPAEPATALPGQEASLSLTPRGGGEDLELRLPGGAAGQDKLPAFFKPRGGDLLVDGAASALFDISPETLRDRSLGYVDLDTVDRIRLQSDGTSLVLQRTGEDWIGDTDGKLRTGKDVMKLVAAFNETKIEAFRTTESAAKTGLVAPGQKIFFDAWLSENTAEDTAGGHVIAGADLGKAAPDGGVYARAAGSAETVTVPAALAEAIRAAVFPPNAVKSPR